MRPPEGAKGKESDLTLRRIKLKIASDGRDFTEFLTLWDSVYFSLADWGINITVMNVAQIEINSN